MRGREGLKMGGRVGLMMREHGDSTKDAQQRLILRILAFNKLCLTDNFAHFYFFLFMLNE